MNTRLLIGGSAVAACALGASALAGMPSMGNPLLAIGEGQPMSWTEAMMNGRVRPVNPEVDGTPRPAVDFYNTQSPNVSFVPSNLTPDLMVTLGTEEHQSLVMQWNPPMRGMDGLSVASFEIGTTGIERAGGLNLSRGSVHFSLGTPIDPAGGTPIWDVSFMLIDKLGRAAGWFLPMPPPGWSVQWIDFTLGNQNGWLSFVDPGFNIGNVVAIRLDEAGSMVTFPLPPPGAAPDFWDWNAWDHVIITPAPGGAAMGLLALALGAPRRRAR